MLLIIGIHTEECIFTIHSYIKAREASGEVVRKYK